MLTYCTRRSRLILRHFSCRIPRLKVTSTVSVAFETCSASEMATRNHEGPFLRVMAFDGQTTTHPEVMCNELLTADRIVTSGAIGATLRPPPSTSG